MKTVVKKLVTFVLLFAMIINITAASAAPNIGPRLAELTALRTERNKTYQMPDGTKLLELYPGIIHYKNDYRDEAEQWKDISLLWDGKRLDTAPYTLELTGQTYAITDKRNGSVVTIAVDSIGGIDADNSDVEMELFNTGFRLVRTVDSILDNKLSAQFAITESENSTISIDSRAFDANGDPVAVDYSIKDGILTENIDTESMAGKTFPIKIDPVIEIEVDSGNSDGWIRTPGSFLNTGTWMLAGNDSSYVYSMFIGYDGITLAPGAIISDVYASLYLTDARADTLAYIYFADEQNPDLPATYADVIAYAHTTNQVDWNDETSTGDYIDTPSLLSPFLEIFNDYGFNDERAILIVTDNGSAGADFYKADTYEAGNMPKLYINYSIPDAPEAPLNFTLRDLGGITIEASWEASENTTDYLLLVSRNDYPETANTTLYEIAYSGESTSVNLSGYNPDKDTFYYSVFARNETGYSGNASAQIGSMEFPIGDEDMEALQMNFWILLFWFVSLSLLIVNFFRFNVVFAIAAIMINVGITQLPGIPLWMYWAALLLALGEAAAFFVKLVVGKKKSRKRFAG